MWSMIIDSELIMFKPELGSVRSSASSFISSDFPWIWICSNLGVRSSPSLYCSASFEGLLLDSIGKFWEGLIFFRRSGQSWKPRNEDICSLFVWKLLLGDKSITSNNWKRLSSFPRIKNLGEQLLRSGDFWSSAEEKLGRLTVLKKGKCEGVSILNENIWILSIKLNLCN